MDSIKNHLLISTSNIFDPFFSKSVVYLFEHNSNGAIGFIINKNIMDKNFKSVIKIKIDKLKKQFDEKDCYLGGPILLDNVTLFKQKTSHSKNKNRSTGEISISNYIKNFKQEKICGNRKLIFGYSGWSPGQLENEVKNGDWLLQKANQELIFNTPSNQIWGNAIQSLGLNINDIIGAGGIA